MFVFKKIFKILNLIKNQTLVLFNCAIVRVASSKFSVYSKDKVAYFNFLNHNRIIVKRIRKDVRNGEKIKVCFFVMLDSVFAARPIMNAMLKDDLFDPFIVVVPDVSRGEEHMNSCLNSAYESLLRKYKKVFKGYSEGQFHDYSKMMDMVFFPTPYIGMTHDYFEIDYFRNKDVLLLYVNYAYSVLKFVREVVSLPTYNYFWKVFVENKDNILELKKYQSIRGKNAVLSGYCKMDELANQAIIHRERKRVIIAPHHTVGDWKLLQISNFLEYCDFFMDLPKKYPNIDFVFRPHPLLMVQLRKNELWGPEKTNKYLVDLLKNTNVEYSKGGEYFDIFANSDGIIHDCGSFLAEYMFTGNPTCYILRNKESIKENFLSIGEACLDFCYKAFSKEDIIDFIENVIIDNKDYFKNERIKFVNEELKINYPRVSKFILNYLKENLKL